MAEFLEFDFEKTSTEQLLEYVDELKENPNHHVLVARIRKELVLRAMKGSGLSSRQIVKALTQSRDKRTWGVIADEWAGVLALTKPEFLRIASGKTVDPSRR